MAQYLSSRYLHLHQALGLGPMWLRRSAQVLPPAAVAAAAEQQPASAAHPPADAHQAALAAVHPAVADAAAKTAPPVTPVATPESAARPTIRVLADNAHALAEQVRTCDACDLHRTRQQALWGQGSLPCQVLLVTPQPNPDDDVAAAAIDGLWQTLILAGIQEVTPLDVDVLTYEIGGYFGMIVAAYQPV